MQTTLRIDPILYRDAKASAAREGITLTRFIESALQNRLNLAARRVAALPLFDSGAARDLDVLALMHAAEAEYGEDQAASLAVHDDR
jgi:hypothetical protein